MPVHRTKKDTTTNPSSSTQEQPVPPLPDQQEFHHYLRTLAQSAVRTVIEAVMREELEAFIGAAWGEVHSHLDVVMSVGGTALQSCVRTGHSPVEKCTK